MGQQAVWTLKTRSEEVKCSKHARFTITYTESSEKASQEEMLIRD